MKHLIIVHGWGGTPEEGWFPWLKTNAETKGFTVSVPQLPHTTEPRINSWVPTLVTAINDHVNDDVYLIGHSMGCQTIARAIEKLEYTTCVKGIIYVAGFFTELTGLEEFADTPEKQKIVNAIEQEWLTTPFNTTKASTISSVAIFSENDPYVPLSNINVFKNTLHSEIITMPNMKHFSGSSGTVKLPIVLEKLLKLAE